MQLTNKHVFQPGNCTYMAESKRTQSDKLVQDTRVVVDVGTMVAVEESHVPRPRQTFHDYLPSVIAFPLCLRSCRDNSLDVGSLKSNVAPPKLNKPVRFPRT